MTLIGHQRIWDYLINSARRDRLAHAYFFAGSSELGKKTLAMEFSRWLLCQGKKQKDDQACGLCRSCQDIQKGQHPDVFFLAPSVEEKKGITKTFQISIEQIKELRSHLSLSAFFAAKKIAIIDNADWLTREAASAFLKTLEEPSSRSLIFILAPSVNFVLPTIISRCQLVKFLPVAQATIAKGILPLVGKGANLEKIVKLAAGKPGRAVNFARNPELLSEFSLNLADFQKALGNDLNWRFELAKHLSQNAAATPEVLAQWLLWLRDRLLGFSDCAELATTGGLKHLPAESFSVQRLLVVCREIQKTQDFLGNASINSRLALEILMTKI